MPDIMQPVKDWVGKEIEKAKLEAQIAVMQTIILGLSAQLENLKRSRAALG